MPKRDDLPPLERAVSDALDDINHRCHGLISSWAYPEEFLEALSEADYTVVKADLRFEILAALDGEETDHG